MLRPQVLMELSPQLIPIAKPDILPSAESVLLQMGVPVKADISNRVSTLVQQGLEIVRQFAKPKGLLAELSIDDFSTIYNGLGKNEPGTPLTHIYTQAHSLSLFAVTLGDRICQEIDVICHTGNVALGGVLDAAAAAATDNCTRVSEAYVQMQLFKKKLPAEMQVLAYSPGYCGWDISGQKLLFEFLKPMHIGITLTDNFVMHPIKSISGILVAGNKEIHRFKPQWEFCRNCRTHSCLQRMESSN